MGKQIIAASDLGFGNAGIHDKRLTSLEDKFLGILWVDHSGDKNKISGGDLAVRLAWIVLGVRYTLGEHPEEVDWWKRRVRVMQNHILWFHRNIPLLSKSGINGGYWMAETEEEAEAFYRSFRQRGMTGLVKASRGKQSAIVEAFEQLAFNFEDMVDKVASKDVQIPRIRTRNPADNMAPELVDSMLEKMTRNPEKFADSLRNLKAKYFSGGVMLDAAQLAAIKQDAADLLAKVSGLEG